MNVSDLKRVLDQLPDDTEVVVGPAQIAAVVYTHGHLSIEITPELLDEPERLGGNRWLLWPRAEPIPWWVLRGEE